MRLAELCDAYYNLDYCDINSRARGLSVSHKISIRRRAQHTGNFMDLPMNQSPAGLPDILCISRTGKYCGGFELNSWHVCAEGDVWQDLEGLLSGEVGLLHMCTRGLPENLVVVQMDCKRMTCIKYLGSFIGHLKRLRYRQLSGWTKAELSTQLWTVREVWLPGPHVQRQL